MEVLRKKKIKMVEDSSDSEVEFPTLVRPKLGFSEKITTEVISPTVKRTGTRKTELEKLEIEPLQRRRTRGDQTAANREIRSNLRSAFNFGLGVFRSVSQSLPKFLKYD